MKCFGMSDIGLIRETNQDSFFYAQNDSNEFLAIICDGIGGGKAGDVASQLAISSLQQAFAQKPAMASDVENQAWINEVVTNANALIYEESLTSRKKIGMGTTLVAALVHDDSTLVFHMGDSRVYGVYDQEMICLTEDHNLAADLIKSGEISEEEAMHHPKGKALTNALGIWSQFHVDINKVKQDYDYLLLCSDGLHGYIQEKIIKEVILSGTLTLQDKVQSLVNASIQAGGFDNITVILIEGKRGNANE